jgi:exopolyphosphatase/guanosine-5'-triphosphate,3'-diphosphate pyrophosphatase
MAVATTTARPAPSAPPPVPASRIVAFLDVGTNSIRLLVVRIEPPSTFSVLLQRREAVRLGEGEFEKHILQEPAIQRAVLVGRNFAEIARSQGAEEIVGVATSATREARNQREFLGRFERETGLRLRVIAGREEARLIYRGVASGLNLGDARALFIDIGGGSTELIVGDQRRHTYLDSLKLGAIRLQRLYLARERGPISDARYRQITDHVRSVTVRSLQRLRGQAFDMAVGSSGTIENLADMAVRDQDGRRREADDRLDRDSLRSIVRRLRALSLAERREFPGINPERADLIVPGAAILEVLMDGLELDELRISDRGLRDGLLVDWLARHSTLVGADGPGNPREESVLRLARSMGFEEAHAGTVGRLAVQLFDSARQAGWHAMGAVERELLQHAAALHDIGTALSYSNHHVHGAYFIRNFDLLGFDQREIGALAAIVYFHRKGQPKDRHPELARFDTDTRRMIQQLAVFLRLAEGLDHSHLGLVQRTWFESRRPRHVILVVEAAQDCPLEMWAVAHQEKTFRTIFRRGLEAERRPPPAAAAGESERRRS